MQEQVQIDGQVLWVSIGVDPELVEQTMGLWRLPIEPVYTTYDDLERLFGKERPLLPSILIVNDGVIEAKLVGSGAFEEAARRMKR